MHIPLIPIPRHDPARDDGRAGRRGRGLGRRRGLTATLSDLDPLHQTLVALCLLAQVVVLDAVGHRLPLEKLRDLAKVLGVLQELVLEDLLLRVGPGVEELALVVLAHGVEDEAVVVLELAAALLGREEQGRDHRVGVHFLVLHLLFLKSEMRKKTFIKNCPLVPILLIKILARKARYPRILAYILLDSCHSVHFFQCQGKVKVWGGQICTLNMGHI